MAINNYEFLHKDVFSTPVIKTNCCSVDYINSNISAGLEAIFAGDRVKKNPLSWSTCPIPGALLDLQSIPGISPLLSWMTASILENAALLDKPNATSVTFTKGWTNRLFTGCSNQCHTHKENADGVVIFYYDVPQPESSELVLIKNGKNETPLNMYPQEDCFSIPVKTGDLVIHHSSIPHAISTHKNPLPRTCLVFNFLLS